MGYSKTDGAKNAYGKVGVESAIESASPHRLIQMLMEGMLEKVHVAKGFMERGDLSNQGSHISWAISIVDGLRMSLDKEVGGELAENLDNLYDYMSRRLIQANIEKNPAYLDEVSSLMQEIKSGWDAIPEEFHNKTNNAEPQHNKDELMIGKV